MYTLTFDTNLISIVDVEVVDYADISGKNILKDKNINMEEHQTQQYLIKEWLTSKEVKTRSS